MAVRKLSLDQARRLALAAQGFDRPRPEQVLDAGHLRRVIRRLGLLQLDFVNVLTPAHYQVLFSRLGPYPISLFDRAFYQGKQFTEQWAHEASVIPVETWPLLRDRMENHRPRPWGFEDFMAEHPEAVQSAFHQVRERGPLGAEEVELPDHLPTRSHNGAWSRSIPRCILEAFFGRGIVGVADRRKNFARRYDLVERVVPEEHVREVVPVRQAHQRLLRQAARGLGVATVRDLADYYRMSPREARPRIEELVEKGDLRVARVEGWHEEAFLDPEAPIPRAVEAESLISPFDPLVWFRPRTQRLFGFEYRLEIFVPAPQRRWGYYVLPFLLGDRLVARVDLKADRQQGRLQVLAGFLEDGAEPKMVSRALGRELKRWARWLGLASVRTEGRNPFLDQLAAEVE